MSFVVSFALQSQVSFLLRLSQLFLAVCYIGSWNALWNLSFQQLVQRRPFDRRFLWPTTYVRMILQCGFRTKALAFVATPISLARPIVAIPAKSSLCVVNTPIAIAIRATDQSATVDLAISVFGTNAAESAPCCNRSFGHFCDQENMYSASFESS